MINKFTSLVLHSLFLIDIIKSGTIWPGSIAIENTIANINEYSDYTFRLKPSTTVPPGGYIEIEFPLYFQAGLGITKVTQSTCSVTCSIDLQLVKFYFETEILAYIETTVKIFQVKNPAIPGGTGNFIVRTKRYEYTYDENLIFSNLGIADTIILLSSTIVTPGTYKAGQLSKYNFAFKTNTNLPKSCKIKLGIPIESGYEVSDFPSCSLYPINGQYIPGSIKCQKEDNWISIVGFDRDIGSGSEVGISVSLTNPKFSIITGKFSIAAFRNRTSVIYTWRRDINSIQITPGDISEVKLTNVISTARRALNKVMDYQLQFLPSNPLPEKSIIKIEFPQTFQLVVGTNYDYVFLNEGLEDINEDQTLQIKTAATYIILKNYKGNDKPQIITITFRARFQVQLI